MKVKELDHSESCQKLFVIRNFPVDLHQKITIISNNVGVTIGEIARAMFEFSLDSYDSGYFSFNQIIEYSKKTLYPKEGKNRDEVGWKRNLSNQKPTSIDPNEKIIEERKYVGFHGVPIEIQNRIKSIAKLTHLSVGVVAGHLISHAVLAYLRGELVFTPIVVQD
jgi:hypothetical protein